MAEQLPGNGIYYEEVIALGEVSQAEAQQAGLFDCADAGMWLRQLPSSALVIKDGFDGMMKRAIAVMEVYDKRPFTLTDERWPLLADLLRAAVGEEDE